MADNDSAAAPVSRGAIALVALCHEYCLTLDAASEATSPRHFARRILGLLPRIYITAFDLPDAPEDAEDIPATLDEEQYAAVAADLSRLFGEHDTYLEAFHEDMKYSETPVAASLSEQLADLYQAFYDFTAMVRELPADSIDGAVAEMAGRFRDYWSENLCTAPRVINYLNTSRARADED
ncbi:MAG: DUF5063 domain-containing protein [Muribaculaceae bacterium]|nr:DUF5063 domain-containing protein [Muribaculaceae bacterium]